MYIHTHIYTPIYKYEYTHITHIYIYISWPTVVEGT